MECRRIVQYAPPNPRVDQGTRFKSRLGTGTSRPSTRGTTQTNNGVDGKCEDSRQEFVNHGIGWASLVRAAFFVFSWTKERGVLTPQLFGWGFLPGDLLPQDHLCCFCDYLQLFSPLKPTIETEQNRGGI